MPFILLSNVAIFLHLSQGKINRLILIYIQVLLFILGAFYLSKNYINTWGVIGFYILTHVVLVFYLYRSSLKLIDLQFKNIVRTPRDIFFFFRILLKSN